MVRPFLRVKARQVIPRRTARRKPILSELLTQFDPELHGGEVMAWLPIGVEVHS